jgi:hypothetical protein
MRRIVVWIDCRDEDLEATHAKLIEFFGSLKLVCRIVEVSELIISESR